MASLPVDLQPDERVIMRVHRHFVFLLAPLIGIIIFGIIPTVVLFMMSPTNGELFVILAVVWGLITLIVSYFIWYRYYYDEWIITNQRLIDSVKKNWFHQHLVSTDLINIEDMSISKNGVFQTILNYGDLRCETAGEKGHFVLNGIPNPSGVLDTVDAARDDARRKLGSASRVLHAT